MDLSATEGILIGPEPLHSFPPTPVQELWASSLTTCCRWSWPEEQGEKMSVKKCPDWTRVAQNRFKMKMCCGYSYLCDHAADVSGVRGQEDGVGFFGQFGESRHVLFSHTEGSCCISILFDAQNR